MSRPIEVIPADAVSPEWLTAVLRAAHIDATVARLRSEPVGNGQVGETKRFFLEYQGTAPPDAPATVVGKFSSNDPVAANTGRTIGFYKAEVWFYREIAPRARLRVPHAYLAELDEQNNCALVFEDLAPAQTGNQVAGIPVEDARLALVECAKLHAAFWNDTELEKQPWLSVPPGAQGFYTSELLASSWDYYKKTYPGVLAAEVVDLCDRFVSRHAEWNRPRPYPKVYSHNDFRADNMLFGGADGRAAIVDWQTSSFLGTGMDVAYFLGGAFDRATRRAHEGALLRFYHDELIANGVKDYSFDHLMSDYRHYSFAALVVAIVASVIVKRTERGDRLLAFIINSAAHQALDNHALDILPT